MDSRQTMVQRWMIVDQHSNLVALPRDTGLLLLRDLPAARRRGVRQIARLRGLAIADESRGEAARVHNIGELRRALLKRTPLVLLSPLFPTASHPAWQPLPRMRAAALARLGRRRLIALGGMNARNYARVAPLGFIGWAGIRAFRT